jgi:Mg2+-importing ATPase
MIRRFMLVFGPISSLFDFATFAVMLWVFDAGESLFQSGWFVESLATQSLIVFAIRTRRVPFFRSRPSTPLAIATLTCVTIGALLPFSPLADALGFTALPAGYFAFLVGAVVLYLVIVELAKRWFYRSAPKGRPLARPHRERPVHHRASRWSIPGRVPAGTAHTSLLL